MHRARPLPCRASVGGRDSARSKKRSGTTFGVCTWLREPTPDLPSPYSVHTPESVQERVPSPPHVEVSEPRLSPALNELGPRSKKLGPQQWQGRISGGETTRNKKRCKQACYFSRQVNLNRCRSRPLTTSTCHRSRLDNPPPRTRRTSTLGPKHREPQPGFRLQHAGLLDGQCLMIMCQG